MRTEGQIGQKGMNGLAAAVAGETKTGGNGRGRLNGKVLTEEK